MKTLVVTVAGMSQRFSVSLGRKCLKCIYYSKRIEESLLWRMLRQPVAFDRYIVVGGYCFTELERTICTEFLDMANRIILVENRHYADYGSGYSLYLGLQEAMRQDSDEVMFAEGDLSVDTETFRKVAESPYSVITVSPEPVLASKAVAFYFDCKEQIHYLYDTGHHSLEIHEPFTAIYNSGQIWKFADKALWEKIFKTISKQDWQGTNLIMVESYFQQIRKEDYVVVPFRKWINCNTIEDFNKVREARK